MTTSTTSLFRNQSYAHPSLYSVLSIIKAKFDILPSEKSKLCDLKQNDTHQSQNGQFKLMALDYDLGDLEPVLPRQIVNLHYSAHHKNYVENVNKLLSSKDCTKETTGFESYEAQKNSKETLFFGHIIKAFHPRLYFNIGGMLNHNFLWKTLSPVGENTNIENASIKLKDYITKCFGTDSILKQQIDNEALKIMGSGWAWLVYDQNDDRLKITHTVNQDNPFDQMGYYPVYGIDMWEHAYYLKYWNNKIDYLKNLWKIVNWKFIGQNFEETLNLLKNDKII